MQILFRQEPAGFECNFTFFLFSRDLCKHECDMCDSSFGNVVQVIGSIRLICVQKMSEYPSEGLEAS